MSDDDTQLVALRVKRIEFVNAPAPHAHRVDIGLLRDREQLIITRFIDPNKIPICRRPVHALQKDTLTINREDEGDATIVIGLLDQAHGANTETPSALIEFRSLVTQRGLPIVERLRPMIMRPPQLRIGHGETRDGASTTRGRIHRQGA